MRNFVDIVALCGDLLHEDHRRISRVCYINCLSIRYVATSQAAQGKEPGVVIDGAFYQTTDAAAADACVKKIIDVVTEIHESHHMEQAELVNVKMRKTLKEVIDYERKGGDA